MLVLAQNAIINGKIIDNQNESRAGVNPTIKGKEKGTQTDLDGTFKISNLQRGDYILGTSCIGFKTKEIQVQLATNEITNLPTTVMYPEIKLLQEVVTSGRTNKFSHKKTAYVAKFPLKGLEKSNLYSSISNELIGSQLITSFDEALLNATGISNLWESTGINLVDGSGFFHLEDLKHSLTL